MHYLGSFFMKSYGINTRAEGFRFDYNSLLNPSITNEFATGAFRFGHSLVQGKIKYGKSASICDIWMLFWKIIIIKYDIIDEKIKISKPQVNKQRASISISSHPWTSEFSPRLHNWKRHHWWNCAKSHSPTHSEVRHFRRRWPYQSSLPGYLYLWYWFYKLQ